MQTTVLVTISAQSVKQAESRPDLMSPHMHGQLGRVQNQRNALFGLMKKQLKK